MKIKFDYIEKHTAKASLLVYGSEFCWIPKSCYKIIDSAKCEAEIVDGFEVIWKNDEGKIVRKECEVFIATGCSQSIGSHGRAIIIDDRNRNDLWEYI